MDHATEQCPKNNQCNNCGSLAHITQKCKSSVYNLEQTKKSTYRPPCTFGLNGTKCDDCRYSNCSSHYCKKCGSHGHHRSKFCKNFIEEVTAAVSVCDSRFV
jgi:hypothetical protein